MKISKHTRILANELWEKAGVEARFYPVDRPFLERHLEQVKTVDPVEFISYNLTTYPSLYSSQLLFCLPELWQELTTTDILELIESLRTEQALYTLILFTYKYLKVDILQLILDQPNIDSLVKEQIKNFLKAQFYHLILQEEEIEDLAADELGTSLTDWLYVRQKLLTYEGLKPAKQNLADLKSELERL